jgi:hypothetical protein
LPDCASGLQIFDQAGIVRELQNSPDPKYFVRGDAHD